MAARLEAAADPGEILVTDKVKFHSDQRGYFEFLSRRVPLKKDIGEKRSGDPIECYAVNMIKSAEELR